MTVQAKKNETKIFELSMARQVRWYTGFVDLKLPSLIAGPINPCRYFPVTYIVSQIRNFKISYNTCLCKLTGKIKPTLVPSAYSHTTVTVLLVFSLNFGLLTQG